MRGSNRYLFILGAVILAACGSSSQKDSPPEPSGIDPGVSKVPTAEKVAASSTPPPKFGCSESKDCKTCVSNFDGWMRALLDEGHPIITTGPFRIQHVLLSTKTSTTQLPPSKDAEIGTESIFFSGFWSTDGLTSDSNERIKGFSQEVAQFLRLGCGITSPADVALSIDESTPWMTVRHAVQVIRDAGADGVVFVFLKPTSLAHPPKSPIDASIRSIEAKLREKKKAGELAEPAKLGNAHPFERTYASCPQAYEGIVKAAGTDVGKLGFYRAGLGDALLACKCQVNFDSARALHWSWSGRAGDDGRFPTGVRVALRGSGSPLRVSIADETPWSIAHREVLKASSKGRPLSFTFPGDGNRKEKARAVPHACAKKSNALDE